MFKMALEERINKAQEIALNLLNLGLTTEQIRDATGLSIEEIEELPNFEDEYFEYREQRQFIAFKLIRPLVFLCV